MWRLSRPDAAAAPDDPGVRRALPRYVDIVKGKKLAKFLLDKAVPLDFDPAMKEDELWKLHKKGLETHEDFERRIDNGEQLPDASSGSSLLDLKVELARRIMTNCHFCARDCGVNRLSGKELGYCRCGVEFSLSSSFLHMGEEPELVPSGTVFTCGCSIRCMHCQNWEISQHREAGRKTSLSTMADVVEELKRRGARNLNMVGGDPTPYCWHWLSTMQEVDANIATVWNSNSYYSEETASLLARFIDVYLLDFKYGNDLCASEISDASGYWEECTRNHRMAQEHGELIIRVLVLPGHNDCCTRPILRWISENLGPWTRTNLMFQYRPEWRAHEREELRRRLTSAEVEEARQIAKEVGLKNLVRG